MWQPGWQQAGASRAQDKLAGRKMKLCAAGRLEEQLGRGVEVRPLQAEPQARRFRQEQRQASAFSTGKEAPELPKAEAKKAPGEEL